MERKNLFKFYTHFQLYTSDEFELGSIFGLSAHKGIFFPKKQIQIKTNKRSEKRFEPVIQMYQSLDYALSFLEQHEPYELISKLSSKGLDFKFLKTIKKDEFQETAYNYLRGKKENPQEILRNAGILLIDRIQSQKHLGTKNPLENDFNTIKYCLTREKGNRR